MSEESARKRLAPTWVVVLLATPIVVVGLGAWFFMRPREETILISAKSRLDIAVIAEALDDYASRNNGEYPDALDALVAADRQGFKCIDREKVPQDQWGNEYRYEPARAGQPLRVYTYGADGAPGGAGKDRDIDNAMVKAGMNAPPGHEQE